MTLQGAISGLPASSRPIHCRPRVERSDEARSASPGERSPLPYPFLQVQRRNSVHRVPEESFLSAALLAGYIKAIPNQSDDQSTSAPYFFPCSMIVFSSSSSALMSSLSANWASSCLLLVSKIS